MTGKLISQHPRHRTQSLTDREIDKHWRMAKASAARWRRKSTVAATPEDRRRLRLKSHFTISKDYLQHLDTRQQGRCFYTSSKLQGVFRPALVRRDPQRGWVQRNVVWAAYPIALAKRHWPDDALIGFARRIVRTAKENRRPRRPLKKIRSDSKLDQGVRRVL